MGGILQSPFSGLGSGGPPGTVGPPGTLLCTLQYGHFFESPCRSVGALFSVHCLSPVAARPTVFPGRSCLDMERRARRHGVVPPERVCGPVATQRRPSAQAWRWVVQRHAQMEIAGDMALEDLTGAMHQP